MLITAHSQLITHDSELVSILRWPLHAIDDQPFHGRLYRIQFQPELLLYRIEDQRRIIGWRTQFFVSARRLLTEHRVLHRRIELKEIASSNAGSIHNRSTEQSGEQVGECVECHAVRDHLEMR